ncbi:MAG: ABC transporter permease [Clostridia bacterium]|nr:ABC transporter permease [Clostridia bacterium]MBR4459329.1 ABC transporter permease [Clostridia bacterium]
MAGDMFHLVFTPGTFLNMFNSATVVILAGLGCLLTDQAGMMNIGLDGIMVSGAFTAAIVSWLSGSWIVGLLCAVCVGMLFGLFYGLMVIRWKSDEFIIGVAFNIFAVALTTFLLRSIDGQKGSFHPATGFVDRIPALHLGVIGDTPINISIMVPLAIVLVILCQILMYRTPFGFWLHASGEHADALRSVGRSPDMMKYLGSLGCGLFCGLSGAYLSLGYLSTFQENMTDAKGFVAVACVIFGRSNPVLVFLAALLFGFIDAAATRLQDYLNPTLTATFPYIGTVLMMLVIALARVIRKKKAAS